MDVAFLSRLQFGLTLSFHYVFPPLSIGLGLLMVLMEATYLWTGKLIYHQLTKFWSRIFAVNFAMGVATGIPMEFQFGTNWARYARFVGDVFGSALAAEGIFAFFLESGFLAVLVFGWDRVSKRMHFVATVMVFFGSVFSAIWIVVANSWMHTPAGHAIVTTTVNGQEMTRAVMTDFWALMFNPSSMQRLGHVLLGAFIQGAFFVTSIAAYYLLKGRHREFARRSFGLALGVGLVAVLLMGISGHFQAKLVAAHQPAKFAAYEGIFRTGEGGTEMHLVGWPNEGREEVEHSMAVPGLLSFLVYEDFNKPVPGLDKFRPVDRPPILLPFLNYHVMVGIAGVLTLLALVGSFFWWRGTLERQRWLLWLFVFAVIGPYVANQAGWIAAETGRQPFVVYPEVKENSDGTFGMVGGMRTVDGLSERKVVTAEQVATSMVLFFVIYLLLFFVWVYVLHQKVTHGPDEDVEPPAESGPKEIYDVAARRGQPGQYSLTGERSGRPNEEG